MRLGIPMDFEGIAPILSFIILVVMTATAAWALVLYWRYQAARRLASTGKPEASRVPARPVLGFPEPSLRPRLSFRA